MRISSEHSAFMLVCVRRLPSSNFNHAYLRLKGKGMFGEEGLQYLWQSLSEFVLKRGA